MTLRDALATALDTVTGQTNQWHAVADAILSDPTFRLALTEAIAEALLTCDLMRRYREYALAARPGTMPAEPLSGLALMWADAIVARILL